MNYYEMKIGKEVSLKMLDHEEKRFYGMTQKELTTRLYKITKEIKLLAFMEMARLYGYNRLRALAKEKLDFFLEGIE